MGYVSLVSVISILFLALVLGRPFNKEEKLHHVLFKKYDNEIRPVKDLYENVTVEMGMIALIIIDTDEGTDSFFKMKTWLLLSWYDQRLEWKPCYYGGLNLTRVPYKKIWRPDIGLLNSGEPEALTPSSSDNQVLIHHDGRVLYAPTLFLSVPCRLHPNATANPECAFTFGSWNYDIHEIDLDFYEGKKAIDLGRLTYSDRWIALSSTAKKEVQHYPCCPNPYPKITYKIKLRQRKI